MSRSEVFDPRAHVRLTREFMDTELRLDRLLELTYGLAATGAAAVQLVLPALARYLPPNWSQLAGIGLAPRVVVSVGEDLESVLGQLEPWTGPAIDAAIDAMAMARQLDAASLRSVAALFVLGELSSLPIAPVLEVMGAERSLARLHASAASFKSMQMVG